MIKSNLRELRRAVGTVGYTQEELAIQVGVTRSCICKIEKGKIKPSAELMFKIARCLRRRVDEIFSLDDSTE